MKFVRSVSRGKSSSLARAAISCILLCACAPAFATEPVPVQPLNTSEHGLELSRPIRSWEFVSALGKRSGVLGKEQGTFEAWVYPVKILRDFHLNFRVNGEILPAETVARTLVVRPESTTIVYAGDDFSVRETLFAPVDEAGVIIALHVDTVRPLEIGAIFRSDFQLEWPGGMGESNKEWDPVLHAFRFESESGRFDALVGSPSATKTSEEYSSNYSHSSEDSFLLGPTLKGTDDKLIVIAASFAGRAPLANLYDHLAKDYLALLTDSAEYYRNYLARTVNLRLPDAEIEKAYDWARVSMLQGLVHNLFLGEGLVAGFDTSGEDARPGFGWFFGRDAEWTSLAFDAAGDFSTARTAL